MKKGFTLLEILIVISLMTLLGVMGMGVYGKVRQNEDIASVVIQVVHILNSARTRSVTGEKDMEYKVRVESDRVQVQDEVGEVVEEYVFPEKYTLNSPATELVFGRIDGRVVGCESGCVLEVVEVDGGLNYQIKLLFSGVVEY